MRTRSIRRSPATRQGNRGALWAVVVRSNDLFGPRSGLGRSLELSVNSVLAPQSGASVGSHPLSSAPSSAPAGKPCSAKSYATGSNQ